MTDSENSDYDTDGSSTELLDWITSSGDSGIEFDQNRTLVRRHIRLTREYRHLLYKLRKERLGQNG